MNKETLHIIINNWIKDHGTKSFRWLYKKITDDSILLTVLNDNCYINSNLPIAQKIYHFFYDVNEIPVCKYCNKELIFMTFSRPYQEFCNNTCSKCYFKELDYTEINEKRKDTMISKYGKEYPMQVEEFKENYKETFLTKYGVDWNTKVDSVKKQISHTWKNKPNLADVNKKKGDNWKNSLAKKYGDDITSPFCLESVQEKNRETMMERYGVDYGFQSKEIREKGKETCIKRYGYPNAMNSKDIQRKNLISGTKLKPYTLPSGKQVHTQGYNSSALDILFKNGYQEYDLLIEFDCFTIEYQENNTKHYYRPDIYIKSDNKIVEVKSIFTFMRELDKNITKYKSSVALGYNFEFWIFAYSGELLVFDFKLNKISDCLINCGYTDMIYGSNFIFLYNELMLIHIQDMKITTKPNYIIELKKHLKWNSNKSIELINVFDYYLQNKFNIIISRILNKLGHSEKIYARKCSVREIDISHSKEFLNNTHIQGNVNASVKLGLFYNDKLVSVMTFGSKRVALGNKCISNEFELLRFSTKLNTTVVGGASKLLSYFIKKYTPNKIISYADRNWSNGNLYEKMNFELIGETPPNYWYYKDNKMFHRFRFRKDVLVSMGYDSTKTEHEIMDTLGYNRIYDCGNLKYLLSL